MNAEIFDVFNTHQRGESATYPQAALARRLALLLLIAGNGFVAPSQTPRQNHLQARPTEVFRIIRSNAPVAFLRMLFLPDVRGKSPIMRT